jgi:hypothetical protein
MEELINALNDMCGGYENTEMVNWIKSTILK